MSSSPDLESRDYADKAGMTGADALPIVAPQPRVASAEEVEQLMKRMEEDFGKL